MTEHEWDDNDYPLAYFITFRTHGTWLHGDQRSSVDRHGKNIYSTPRIGLDPVFSVTMDRNMATAPMVLGRSEREVVETAIRAVCRRRDYGLIAVNIRTNHAHVVASGVCAPDKMMSAFKANATRELREAGLVSPDARVWSRGGSTRYLWKPRNVERAVNYTLYGQGDELPKF
jgi:REP element-mobilizing transposase RayT